MKQYHTHYSALTSLGVPIIVGQIGIIILGFADRLPIDWHSTLEFAAVAFVNNMFVLVLYYFCRLQQLVGGSSTSVFLL